MNASKLQIVRFRSTFPSNQLRIPDTPGRIPNALCILRKGLPRGLHATNNQETDPSKHQDPPVVPPHEELSTSSLKDKEGMFPKAISLDVIRGRTAEDGLVLAAFLKILQFSPASGHYLIFASVVTCMMLFAIKLILKAKLHNNRFFPFIWFCCCAVAIAFFAWLGV